MMRDQKFDKWLRWLKAIDEQVTAVFFHREVWLGFRGVIEANKALPPSIYFQSVALSYGASQAVAVRRIAEEATKHRPVASLGCLIADIRDNPQELTPARWLDGVPDALERSVIARDWDRHFGGSVHKHLDPAIASTDVDSLRAATDPIRNYVDEYVAHSDINPSSSLPAYADLHSAIDSVGKLFGKYKLLLTATDWSFVGIALPPGWQRIFAMPWSASSAESSRRGHP
jgi:hypothetical protein